MILNTSRDNCPFYDCIDRVKERLSISFNSGGVKLNLEKSNEFELLGSDDLLTIKYRETVQIFRGLSLAAQEYKVKRAFRLTEQQQFKTSGIMLDMSQNGVMKVEAVKSYIEMMALMGHNRLYLYLEDIYQVEGVPYFGYMRGRYSQEELSEVDQYAYRFGIETIPIIQTLGHLSRVLQWNFSKDIRDTNEILLVDCNQTYQFLRKIIRSISACFRTNQIHLGMDESTSLGLGNYRIGNGNKASSELMVSHLSQVIAITDELGLEAMIWSDMFFRLCSEQHDYYDLDAEVSSRVRDIIPKDLSLVYWDYYHHDSDFYDQMITKHKELTNKLMFATGIWTWNSTATNYKKTFDTMTKGLMSCKRNNVQHVITTIWGDDGTETNYNSALLGIQFAAEHAYKDHVSQAFLSKRFKTCTGGSYNLFSLMARFDNTPCTDYDRGFDPVYNPSKYCLWQDLLMGLFDNNIRGSGIAQHYKSLHEDYKNCTEHDPWTSLHSFYTRLSGILAIKSELGIKIKHAYDVDDKESLSQYMNRDITELISELRKLHEQQGMLWHESYKAFGWEVLDIRYGGLIARMVSARMRLKGYIDGTVIKLEELEEERLPYGAGYHFNNQKMLTVKNYEKCVTAGQLNHNPGG